MNEDLYKLLQRKKSTGNELVNAGFKDLMNANDVGRASMRAELLNKFPNYSQLPDFYKGLDGSYDLLEYLRKKLFGVEL
jgi:hypothetical protein